jgi:hypothetical protein
MALKPGTPCVVVSTGGTPVSEAPAGFGAVLTPASNGKGIPVRIVAGRGVPIVFVSEAGALLPGGA